MRRLLAAAIGLTLFALLLSDGAGASAGSAASEHIRRFTVHTSAYYYFGAHHDMGVDHARAHGKVVGYAAFTEERHTTAHNVFRFALALKGGLIVGRVVHGPGSPVDDGPLVFGNGVYKGIEGSATIKERQGKQVLILDYVL